jgi:ABC-type branched-subunit amino acid transport system substrate-binding protein
VKADFPNGAKAAIFRVNNEFGQIYEDSFKALAAGAGVTIVDTQTIEATDSAPPTPQITSIAAKTPDVIIAAPLGAQCISFLKEIANAKAQNPAFKPRVYITNTCSSSLLIGAAAEAADGVYTTAALKDVNDPANAADPAIVLMKGELTKAGFSGDFGTAAAGWGVGEATVKALIAAAQSPKGMSRASILNAARTLSYDPPLFRKGITYKLNGTEDAFAVESLQVIQYQFATKTYKDIGPVITEFEGKTKAS